MNNRQSILLRACTLLFGTRLRTWIVYCVGALFFSAMWVWGAETLTTSVNGDPRSTLEGLLHGTAHNPYVQRALVPLITGGIYGLIPANAQESLVSSLSSMPKVRKESARLGFDLRYLPEYLIAFAIDFLALLGFLFAFRALFASLYDAGDAMTSAIPFAGLFCLPPFFLAGTHYIYDFPALLFFTLGLLLMVRRSWRAYYIVFALGCLNKETMAILALALVLLFFDRMQRTTLVAHLAAHGVLFGAIKIGLMAFFAANPGGSLEFHLWGNIHNALMPYTFGALALAVLIAVLVWYDFDNKPLVLRRSAWLLVPFVVLMALFAWMHELRDMYEVFPVYFLLAAHTIAFSWMKEPAVVKEW